MASTQYLESPTAAVRRLPVLDGLRGAAILSVLVYHFYLYAWVNLYLGQSSSLWRIADLGWSGVDLFFVLSGFLITSILLKTRTSPDYFGSFYARRALRILPLYFVCVFPLFHLQHFPVAQDWLGSLPRDHEIWFWTFLANWKIPSWTDVYRYRHFWSLCVEEQFYLVWPLVVWKASRRIFPWICGTLMVLCFAVGAKMEFAGLCRDCIRFSTFPRASGILIGALIAWFIEHQRFHRIPMLWKYLAPAALLLLCMLGWRSPQHFRGWYTAELGIIALCWSSVLFHCLVFPSSLLAKFFEHRLLRLFGRYSYAMYCLHLLVLNHFGWYVRKNIGMIYLSNATPIKLMVLFFAFICGVLGAGIASWYILEKHFLQLRRYFRYRPSEQDSGVVAETKAALTAGA